jgi:putative tryptophan/tyrosine transport system substrate-binding protein
MAELGWSTSLFGSGNLKVEYQVTDPGTTDVAPMAAALARANCDLIVATGGLQAVAATAAAPSTPLVFLAAGDPVAAGLVRRMAQPGGHVTGRRCPGRRVCCRPAGMAPWPGCPSGTPYPCGR